MFIIFVLRYTTQVIFTPIVVLLRKLTQFYCGFMRTDSSKVPNVTRRQEQPAGSHDGHEGRGRREGRKGRKGREGFQEDEGFKGREGYPDTRKDTRECSKMCEKAEKHYVHQ